MNELELLEEQSIEQQTETPVEKPKEAIDNSKEFNFRRLENEKRKAQEEAESLRGQIEELSRAKEESSQGDDDLAEMRHVKEVNKEVRLLKTQLKEYQQRQIDRENAEIPIRLKSKFSDFEDVVSVENVERLKKEEPELFSALTSGEDVYTKGIAAYRAIQSLNYTDKGALLEKEQFEKSKNVPRSSQAINGQNAFSEKNVVGGTLSKERKAQYLKEMEEATKHY